MPYHAAMRRLGSALFAGLLVCATAGAQAGSEAASLDGELVLAA